MADPTHSPPALGENTKTDTNMQPEPSASAQQPTSNDDTDASTSILTAALAKAPADDPPPPPKPPRPLNPRDQAEKTLKEAFPSIDAAVVKAVLTASGGDVERGFDALLGMTDPESQQEAPRPAKPPRPAQQTGAPTSTAQSQLAADEMYARQLHEHYSGANRQPRQRQDPSQQARQERRQEEEEREYSFLDDDLPMIRDNIRKGFLETQSTVNKWVTSFKKKLDGDDDESFTGQPGRPTQGVQPGHQGYPNYNRRSSEMARRSADRERYDADPQVLGDDFSTLELRDAEGAPPRKPQRPVANPDLFKSNPPAPNGRNVSFQTGPPDEIDDIYSGISKTPKQQASAGRSSKWQPLSAVEPLAVAENDPFSLGDSDDDKETRVKENKADEAESVGNDAEKGHDTNKRAGPKTVE